MKTKLFIQGRNTSKQTCMDIDKLMQPKPISYYKNFVGRTKINTDLTQEESCVALKVYDYGIECLTDYEISLLYKVFGKLKNNIWP